MTTCNQLPRRGENLLPSHLHGFAAGIIAGAAGVGVGHPFDTLKVQLQVSRTTTTTPTTPTTPTTRPLLALKGSFFHKTTQLYRGVLPPLVSTGVVQSLNFGVYENTRQWLHPRDPHENNDTSPMWSIAAAAFISGAATSPLTAVVTKLKLLQQVKGISMTKILGGIQHLQPFRYYHVHLLLESFGRAVYMSSYVGSKRIVKHQGHDPNEFGWRVACGATSGVVAWTSIYPLDVMRSRLFSSSSPGPGPGGGTVTGGNGKFQEIVAAFKALQKEGALFRGLGFTLVRAAPVAGVVLTCYDLVLDRIRNQ